MYCDFGAVFAEFIPHDAKEKHNTPHGNSVLNDLKPLKDNIATQLAFNFSHVWQMVYHSGQV